MPERSSCWRKWLPRIGRGMTGREKHKERTQLAVQASTTGTSVVLTTSEDAMQNSTTTIGVPLPATLLESISPLLQGPTATSTSASPLPNARAATSGDGSTHANVTRTASPSERLWDRAYDDLKEKEPALLDEYERILSHNLQKDRGASTEPEHQANNICQSDPDERRHQMEQLVYTGLDKTAPEAKMKEGMSRTMGPVLIARDIISSAIGVAPQAALPWTGVCIALEMLANPIKATETNRQGVEYVIKNMNWYCSLFSSLLQESTDDARELSEVRYQLENQIVDLYKVLLTYQIKSVYSYYRHRGLEFLRDIVKLDDWDGNLKAIRDAEKRFELHRKAYTGERIVANLRSQNDGQSKRDEQSKEDEEKKKDEQCLRDLRATDSRHDKTRIEQAKGGILRESCRWILDSPQLKQWQDGPEGTLLWISADPGKGKTMLLCGILDELKKSTGCGFVSFFFCQATDSRINSATAVLRGLIYLLADQHPSLASHLRKQYDSAGKALFEDANSWVALSEIFGNILRDPSLEMTCLVVDALDECIIDLRKLLKLIIDTSSPPSRIKWLLTSRNEVLIKQELGSAKKLIRLNLELQENAKLVSQAVDDYIDDKLPRTRALQDNSLRDEVRDILRQKANGTFLWAAFVIQELESPESLKPLQVVSDVPEGLVHLYDRMVDQIQQRKASISEVCKLMLSIATVAYRPLHLSEIGSLCGVSKDIVKETVDMCGSFLTVQEDQVYLIHQSAKDYLSDEARATFFSSQEKTHQDIYIRSLELMSDTLKRDMYSLNEPGFPIDKVQVPTNDPLETSRYSCVYWIDHLCNSLSDKSIKEDRYLQDGGAVHVFLQEQYLYWLEALSLCRSMSEGAASVAKLESLLKTRTDASRLLELVHDAYRFIMYHKVAIETSPLQAYASALVFSPVRSLIRSYFKQETPKGITVHSSLSDEWSACLQTLEGHGSSVSAVAFSQDGSLLASGSLDRTVRIWDAATGALQQTLHGHGQYVGAVAFSSDSSKLVSGSSDKTVRVWDVAAGTLQYTHDSDIATANVFAFSPDGSILAWGLSLGEVGICDAANGTLQHTLRATDNSKRLQAVAFSQNGLTLTSISSDKILRVWDVAKGTLQHTLKGDFVLGNRVALSRDGSKLASNSIDGTITVWDATTGALQHTLKCHSVRLTAVAFSWDGSKLASSEEEVRVWDVATGTLQYTLYGHSSFILAVAFSRDGLKLASGSQDKTVRVWDMTAPIGTVQQTPDRHSYRVNDIAFSQDGLKLASGSQDTTIRVWDVATGELLFTLCGHSSSVLAVAFSQDRDGSMLASGSRDNTVRVWDAAKGTLKHTLEGHSEGVLAVAFSRVGDGPKLASGSWDSTVRVLDATKGTLLHTLDALIDTVACNPSQVSAVAFPNEPLDEQYLRSDLSVENEWLVFKGKPVLRLPHEYISFAGDDVVAVCNNNIAVGCYSGYVLIIKVDL